MILNSKSVDLIRINAGRLSKCVKNKDDLTELATAGNFEQVFSAIETLLTNTDMYFDDELMETLDEQNWRGFKATLIVYTLNIINKHAMALKEGNANGREFGAATAEA